MKVNCLCFGLLLFSIRAFALSAVTVFVNTGDCARAPYHGSSSAKSTPVDTQQRPTGSTPALDAIVESSDLAFQGIESLVNPTLSSGGIIDRTTNATSFPRNGSHISRPSSTPITTTKSSFGTKPTSFASFPTATPSSSPTTVPSQFLIKYQAGPNEGPSRVHRSEMIVEGYLTANGKGVQDCRTASIFRLSDSYILSTGENGEIYSTESGVLSAPLAASDAIHSIYGIWEMSGDVLRWDNALFSSGTASFCMDGSYSITAYFLVPIPSNCISLEFGILPLSACPAFGQPMSISSPSFSPTAHSNSSTVISGITISSSISPSLDSISNQSSLVPVSSIISSSLRSRGTPL